MLPPEHETIARMVQEGIASWGGGKPRGATHPQRVRGAPVSSTVLEDRR